jgi:hypothetical protein
MTMIMHNKTQNLAANLRSKQSRSLNRGYRQRELNKITGENHALLSRLQEKQPTYSTQQWEEDRKLAERRLKNICEFPYQLGVTDDSHKRHLSVEIRTTSTAFGPNTANVSSTHARTSTGKPRRLKPIGKGAVVYKQGVHIKDNYFIVEMKTEGDMLTILVHEVDQPSSFSLQLTRQEADELMGGTDNYEQLAAMLSFEDGEIVLNEAHEDEERSTSHGKLRAADLYGDGRKSKEAQGGTPKKLPGKKGVEAGVSKDEGKKLGEDSKQEEVKKLKQEERPIVEESKAPVQEKAPTPVPEKAPIPAPEKAPTPAPEKVPTPQPDVAQTPVPEKAPTPPPEEAQSPIPEKAPTPTPEKVPTPQPDIAQTPVPEKAPTPVPEKAPTPAPEKVPTPHPDIAPTPAPEKAATPLPEKVQTPAPEKAPASVVEKAPTPDHADSHNPSAHEVAVPLAEHPESTPKADTPPAHKPESAEAVSSVTAHNGLEEEKSHPQEDPKKPDQHDSVAPIAAPVVSSAEAHISKEPVAAEHEAPQGEAASEDHSEAKDDVKQPHEAAIEERSAEPTEQA